MSLSWMYFCLMNFSDYTIIIMMSTSHHNKGWKPIQYRLLNNIAATCILRTWSLSYVILWGKQFLMSYIFAPLFDIIWISRCTPNSCNIVSISLHALGNIDWFTLIETEWNWLNRTHRVGQKFTAEKTAWNKWQWQLISLNSTRITKV